MTSAVLTRTTETVIRPRPGWAGLDLGELWAYRELAFFFVWRDVKIRYKQTAFGVLWALIQPLALMAVFTIALGRTPGIAPAGTPYALFAFAALVPWTLFAQSLIGASDSLVTSSNLIQKVFFPRLLVPIAAVGSFLLDFVIGVGVLGVLMLFFQIPVTANLIWLLPLTVLALLASLAVGIWLAAVNVRYRDVRYAVPFLVQIWLFASPVAYSSQVVPQEWRALYDLNPMAGVIEGFRWAIFGEGMPPPLDEVAASTLITILILIAGVAYFRRMERTFADVI